MKRKIFILITILTIILSTIKPIKAATGSVTASLSYNSVVLSNKVTLTIKLSCDTGVGGGIIVFSYDKQYLEYLSCNLNGRGHIEGNRILVEPSQDKKVTFTITFSTKKIGSTKIGVNTSQFIDYNGEYISNYSENITRTLQIKAKTTNNSTTTTPLSSDASLASLQIENIDFEQPFSSDIYEYVAYAPINTETIKVLAKASSSKATINKINENVTEGWNEISIVCVAQDKTKKTYIIRLYVEEKPKIIYEDKNLGVVINLDKVSDPEGFERKEIVINENQLTIFNRANLNLIYLADNENNKAFYLYNMENDVVGNKFEPLEIDGKQYLINEVDYTEYNELEKYYKPIKVNIDGKQFDGWMSLAENMHNYRLVYLKDLEGNDALYSYEMSEKTLQKFTLPLYSVEEKMDIKEMLYLTAAIAGTVSLLAAMALTLKRKEG
ncbi:MAG: hypothetical protein QM204_04255 [Bacillota bacterium]|jgi:hypothetical protein|nr:hypothetical protein [Bacillota bacterium]NLL26439.1 hypothetical protein [Erysipelotrichia bacterium]